MATRGRGIQQVEIVERPRLIEQLGARWNHRVVLIEAAGGFGKSTLLRQIVADNRQDPLGTDVVWSVRPNDVGPKRIFDRLYNAAAEALLLPRFDEPGRSALDDLLLTQSPRRICLIIDDAHRLQSDAETLISFADELPLNVSLVLCGRSMQWLPLVSQEARGQIIRVNQQELAFDERELGEFADLNNFAVDALRGHGGWPVLATLSLGGRSEATTDYLFKELVSTLDATTRRSLIAATCHTRVSDKLLAAIGGATSETVIDLVPLSRMAQGQLRVHDLWSDARDDVFDPNEVRDVAGHVFQWLRDNDSAIDAALLALDLDEPEMAREAVLDSAYVGERFLSPPIIQRLLEWFAGRTAPDDPIVVLLRGLLLRSQPTEIENALALYEQAVERFRLEGDLRGEAAALIGQVDVRWARGDRFEELSIIFTRLLELRDLGVHALEPLEQLMPIVLNDLAGDFAEALDACLNLESSTLTPTWANAMAVWTATLAGLCGRSDVAIDVAEDIYERAKSDLSLFALVRATFHGGDPTHALAIHNAGNRLELLQYDSYDAVQVATTWATLAASWGEVVPVTELDFAPPRTREMAYEVIAHMASHVAAHDEEAASAVIETHLDAVGLSDLLSLGELRRWLPYGYVLSDSLRDVFDGEAEADQLGPDHRRSWEISSDFLLMRKGERPRHNPPDAAMLFCGMPLPWAVEYALRVEANGRGDSNDLIDGLTALVGGAVAEELRSIGMSEGSLADRAMSILRTEPAAPLIPAEIRSTQGCEVARNGDATTLAVTPGKLLLALVIRGSMSRTELAATFWPDADRKKANASLRVALSTLRKAIEPERAKGEPSFHLRADEQIVTLHASEHLTVDVWDLRQAVSDGRAHETAGRARSAAAAYERVLANWLRPPLSTLRDLDAFAVEIEELDTDLAEAVVRYSELALSITEPTTARRAAMRVLKAQRFEERAFRVLIRAALLEGDRAEARHQAELCHEWFDKLGLTVTADTKMTIRLTE